MLERSAPQFNETIQNNPHVGFADAPVDSREALFNNLFAAMLVPKLFPGFFQDLQVFKPFLKKSVLLKPTTTSEPKHVAAKRWRNYKLSAEFCEKTGNNENHTSNIKKQEPVFITLFEPIMRDGVTIPFELEALPKLTHVWHFWRLMTGRKTPEESEFYAFLRLVLQSDFAGRKANMLAIYREDPLAAYSIWSFKGAFHPLIACYAAENNGAGYLNRLLYAEAKSAQWLRYYKQLSPEYVETVAKNGYYDFSKNMREFVRATRFAYKIKNGLIDDDGQNTYENVRGRRGVLPRILRVSECLNSSSEHYEAKAKSFTVTRGGKTIKPFADGVVRRNHSKCGSPLCYHESCQLVSALPGCIADENDDYLAFTFEIGHSDAERIDLQDEIKALMSEWTLFYRDVLGGYHKSEMTAKEIRRSVDYAMLFEKTRAGYTVTLIAANDKNTAPLSGEALSGLFIRHLHSQMCGTSALKTVNVDGIRNIVERCLMAMPKLSLEFMREAESSDDYIALCSIFDETIQTPLTKRNHQRSNMGWAKRASRTQIRAAYREQAEARFKILGYTYQIEEDPDANQKYDTKGRPLVEHLARGSRGRIIGSFKKAPRQEDIHRASSDLKDAIKASFKGDYDDLCAQMNRLSVSDLPNLSAMQYTRGLESLLRLKFGDELAVKFRRGMDVCYDFQKKSPAQIEEERRTRLEDFKRRGIIEETRPPRDGDGLEPCLADQTNKPPAIGLNQNYSPEPIPIPG